MIQKLTISKIVKFTTNKEGKPLMGKNGKPYTSVRIQTLEHGEKWLSGFGGSFNDSWKEGDQVTVEVTENGQYLNFSKVDTEAILLDRVKELEVTVGKIRNVLKPIYEEWVAKQPKVDDGYPVNDFSPEEVDEAFARAVDEDDIAKGF